MNRRHRTRVGCDLGLVTAIYTNKAGRTVTFEDRFDMTLENVTSREVRVKGEQNRW